MALSERNPGSGTRTQLRQGESSELVFEFHNSARSPQTYELKVLGLKSDWYSMDPQSIAVEPFEDGVVTLSLHPPVDGKVGEHAFKVFLECDGDRDDTFKPVNLVLGVTPAPQAAPVAPQPKPQPIQQDPPAPVAPPADPPKLEVPRRQAPVADKANPPPAKTTARSTRVPTPTEQPTARHEPAALVIDPPDVRASAPVAEFPEDSTVAPPVASAAGPMQVTPRPKPAPTPKEQQAPDVPKDDVVDIRDGADEPDEPEYDEPAGSVGVDPVPLGVKQVVEDPSDRHTVSLRAGEKAFVRFTFKNSENQARTWVIDNNTIPERSKWVKVIRSSQSVPRNSSGSLSFTFGAPPKTRPGIYELNFAIGSENTALKHYRLFLAVQEEPAVALQAPVPRQWVGPVGRDLNYELLVESAGNADTAYRVAVVDPSPPKDSRGRPKGTGDLYKTPYWRYLFDREIDTVKSSQPNQQSYAIRHALKIRRTGIWWLGWWEKHNFKVRTLPVTDVANGGAVGNIVDLRALRWRLFPLPWFLMAPILFFLFVTLNSGVTEPKVLNAIQQGSSNTWFVLGDKKLDDKDSIDADGRSSSQMKVQFSWEKTSSLGWIEVVENTLSGNGNVNPRPFEGQDKTFLDTVSTYGNKEEYQYQIGPRLLGSASKTDLRFVPLRTSGKLALVGYAGIPGTYSLADQTTRHKIEYTIAVPRGRSTNLEWRNSDTGHEIVVWELEKATGYSDDMSAGGHREINNGGSQTFKISADPTATDATMTLVSTDELAQVIVLHLVATNGGSVPRPNDPIHRIIPQPPVHHVVIPPPAATGVLNWTSNTVQPTKRKEILDQARASLGTTQQFVLMEGGGFLRVLGDESYALFKAHAFDQPETAEFLMLLKKSDGKWSMVEKVTPSEFDALKSRAPDAAKPLFSGGG